MEGTAHRWASPGELVAYALPPGFHWLEILAAHAHSGASFLPIDVRLSDREQQRLIDLARPSVVVRPDEETILADAAPVDPERVVGGRGDERHGRGSRVSRSSLERRSGRRSRPRSTHSTPRRTTPGWRA